MRSRNKIRTLKSFHSSSELDQVTHLVQGGLVFHKQGKFVEAKALYEKALLIQNNQFDALQLLGVLSAQTNQYIKAVDFLSKALKINPNHAACYSNRGNALLELKRFDEAILSYDKADV
jgi:tetratricopeptide (TPR) repeat protein